MAEPGGLDALHGETLLALLIVELHRWLDGPRRGRRPRGGLAPWQARRATELLAARLDGGIGISEPAGACGLSPSHFAQAFRHTTGLPPHRWLTQRRIDRACELMRSSDLGLADIAYACGFAS